MSDIKAGDLVQVINHPCPICKPKDPMHGLFTQVDSVKNGPAICGDMHQESITRGVLCVMIVQGHQYVRPPWCLRKIPPLSDLEGKTTQEKLVDPARAEEARQEASRRKLLQEETHDAGR